MSNRIEAAAEVAMASGEVALQAAECVVPGIAAERVLVDQCRRGDPDAFARLVSLHEGMVFNLSARLLGDAEEAKDLSQEVFLQVYRHLGRFEGRSSLKTWIYRIVVNQCRNRRRWWRRRDGGRAASLDELTPAEEAKASGASNWQESPLDQACRRLARPEIPQVRHHLRSL